MPGIPVRPRIYVASLADYNAGRLHGEWIDADQGQEAILDAISAMLRRSPEPGAEEWTIHDFTGFGSTRLDAHEAIEDVVTLARRVAADPYACLMREPEHTLELPSGIVVDEPSARLRRFCVEEHAYYDAVPSTAPDRIDPVDVLVTVAVNSFVNNAASVRAVHRGLAEACDRILGSIPEDADLRHHELGHVEELLSAACTVRGVLIPVATKVLHRKRRRLIPMLDSVVIGAYRQIGVAVAGAALEDGRRAATAVMPVVEAFRDDLRASWEPLTRLAESLDTAGFPLTPLRILEILIWIESEPRGYYRAEGPAESS